ncbi:CU044_2847 family protein [Actinoplanes sp. NPDC049265]|uniref:CU044_2847 family protein n=1 Tax=Actinoplanes sp. NPDC049265 TaxID=3363902 RepID=UPI00371D38E2
MAAYVELPIDETGDETIRVEVREVGLTRASAGDVIERATQRFDQAIAQVVKIGQDAVRKAREAATPPDGIDVELGLKLTARTGFVIAESSGEANFKVTLRWSSSGFTSTDEG